MPTGWGVVCAGTQSRIIFLDFSTKGRESIFFWANDGAAEEWPVASILNFKFRNLVVGFFVCVSCIVPFYVFFFFFFLSLSFSVLSKDKLQPHRQPKHCRSNIETASDCEML